MRIRIELIDQPGALASVATVLAALGVDVAAVDVLAVDGRTVVDELVLRVPANIVPEYVEDALRMAGAVEVMSWLPGARTQDPAVAALEALRSVVENPGDADAPGRALALVAHADVGALVDVGEAARFPLARRALETGVAAAGPAGPESAPLAAADGWVLWAAPPTASPLRLAVVLRRLNVRFSATEGSRLRSLAGLLEVFDRVQV
ncbi:MAG: hypothetical protein NVS3B26_24340 [Mycobacteriales bacterium]